jgi:hypothetical protein
MACPTLHGAAFKLPRERIPVRTRQMKRRARLHEDCMSVHYTLVHHDSRLSLFSEKNAKGVPDSANQQQSIPVPKYEALKPTGGTGEYADICIVHE